MFISVAAASAVTSNLASTPRPADPGWVKDDLTVIQWIYTRISIELFNLVSTDDATASQLWAAL
jgi:hypothetical protein